MPALDPNQTNQWEKNEVKKISFDWSGSAGKEGFVEIIVEDKTYIYECNQIPQNNLNINLGSGKIINKTTAKIDYLTQ